MKANLTTAGWPMLLALITLSLQPSTMRAQGTAFTYQGRLNANGSPAAGHYDFRFRLAADPSANTILASSLTNGVPVTNGLFTACIDFGAEYFNGSNCWLEVDVKTNGAAGYTALSPLQAMMATPYATFANTASNLTGTLPAAQLSGVIPASQLSGSVANSQLAHSTISVNPGTGLSGGGAVPLGGATTLANAGVLSVTGNADITASTANGAVTLTDNATSANVGNTIVKRDADGNFSDGTITLSGNLILPATTTSGGAISCGGITLIHAFGAGNLFAGNAGNFGMTGGNNTGIGSLAFICNGSGSNNAVNGMGALNHNTTGNGNTANGYWALLGNSTGSGNTANGYNALVWNGTGSFNTADGQQALALNGGGTNNIGLGYQAGYNIQNNNNIDIGNQGTSYDNGIIRIGTTGTHAATYLTGTIYGDSALSVNGNVGIGTGSQAHKLTVQSDDADSDPEAHQIVIQGDTETGQQLELGYKTSGNYATIQAVEQDVAFTSLALQPAGGNVGIGTTSPGYPLTMAGGAYCTGAQWQNGCDRNLKEHFEPADSCAVLEKVAALGITTWNYKAENPSVKHLGPTAQDFKAAFELGDNDRSIGTVDEGGVALAAIQGLNQKLNQKLEEKDAEIATLKEKAAKVDSLERRLTELEQVVQALTEKK